MLKRYAIIFTVIVFCNSSQAFAAATAVTKTQDLNFGSFVGGGGAAGTVTITSSGARSASGGAILLGGAVSAAQLTITGNPGKSYSISLPASYTVSSGTNQMTVSALTSSIPLTGVIPSSGSLPFAIGGTVTTGANQYNSSYAGNFIVTVK